MAARLPGCIEGVSPGRLDSTRFYRGRYRIGLSVSYADALHGHRKNKLRFRSTSGYGRHVKPQLEARGGVITMLGAVGIYATRRVA